MGGSPHAASSIAIDRRIIRESYVRDVSDQFTTAIAGAGFHAP
jgi:hypothetical protein